MSGGHPNTKTPDPHAAAWAMFALPILLLLPFVTKAFHIDDPLFLWTGEQILREPLDFYGFAIHWDRTTQPIYEVNQNPPGVAYYMAPVAAIFGWHETAIHLALALLAGLAGLGTYLLARTWTANPILASVIAVLSPAFLVSATSAMSDVPMVAAYVWALYCWVRGFQTERGRWLLAAGVLAGLAFVTKYFGLTVVALMLLYALLPPSVSYVPSVRSTRPRPRLWPAYLLIPAAMVALYIAWGYRQYGINLLTDAAAIATDDKWRTDEPLWARIITGVLFTGGCFAPVLFFAPLLWSRVAVLAGVITIALLSIPWSPWQGRLREFSGLEQMSWGYQLQLALWFIAGLHVFALIAAVLIKRRDAAVITALAWIAGTWTFSVFLNHVVNARTLLPMAPAIALFVVWRLYRDPKQPPPQPVAFVPLIPAAILALWLAFADYQLAYGPRAAAQGFAAKKQELFQEKQVFLIDHWGFQYYMQREGALPLEDGLTEANARIYRAPQKGDILAVASANWQEWLPDPQQHPLRLLVTIPVTARASTFHGLLGAGFYNHFWGRLPFVFGDVPPEQYAFYEIGFDLAPPQTPDAADPKNNDG